MKFAAVVLLACVAVSSAAFTANLVQQTQPAVAKAMFNIRIATGQKAVAIPALGGIADYIQNAISGIIDQAQALIAHGQTIGAQLAGHLQSAANALSNIHTAAAEQTLQIIQQLLSTVHGAITGRGAFSSAIAQAQAAIQQAFAMAQQLISQIDINALVHDAIVAVLPSNIAQLVIAQMGLNTKGIFGDLFGNIWDQITGAAGSVANQMSNLLNQLITVGSSAVQDLHEQASQFLGNVANGVSDMTATAAGQILAHIGDFAEALGDQYQDVVDALNGIVINGRKF